MEVEPWGHNTHGGLEGDDGVGHGGADHGELGRDGEGRGGGPEAHEGVLRMPTQMAPLGQQPKIDKDFFFKSAVHCANFDMNLQI